MIDDPDFEGGDDRIIFAGPFPAGVTRPFRIEVELVYQQIAFR